VSNFSLTVGGFNKSAQLSNQSLTLREYGGDRSYKLGGHCQQRFLRDPVKRRFDEKARGTFCRQGCLRYKF
jgi:hypothetical protein